MSTGSSLKKKMRFGHGAAILMLTYVDWIKEQVSLLICDWLIYHRGEALSQNIIQMDAFR